MKKALLIIFFVILSINVLAQEENYNDYSSLVIKTDLSSQIELTNNAESLEAILLLFPINYNLQDLLSFNFNSNPQATYSTNNEVIYIWRNVEGIIDYGYTTEVKVYSKFYPIKHIDFPLRSIDSSLQPYAEASEYIDINEDIITQANEIVAGESDLFTVVFKTADWVNTNIEYNLSTLTADVVEKSSWVLENRKGVCDEMTNLFISMLRSLGIPAKFISGTVYSNVNYDWSPHGWAEVYFPDIGWVPFDVTFAQYGWIDPSHVKLMDSIDSNEPSVKYTWKSTNAKLNTYDLTVKSSLVSKSILLDSPISLDLNTIRNNVKQGSFVPLEVTVNNPTDYYIADNIIVTIAPGLTEKNTKHILLKPGEERIIYWIVKIPENINEDYLYTTRIEVKDLYNNKANSEIKYGDVFDYLSLQEAQDYVNKFSSLDEKSYSNEASLDCTLNKSYYYIYENALLNCRIKNIGNTVLNNLNLCVSDNCKVFDLSITESNNLEFLLTLNNLTNQLIINLKNNLIDIEKNIPIKVYDQPNLRINKVDYPKEIEYNENFVLETLFSSDTIIKDAVISINNRNLYEKKDFSGIQKLDIRLNSRKFVDKNITLVVDYEDENNKPYKLERELQIKVTNIPFYVKIWLFIKGVF